MFTIRQVNENELEQCAQVIRQSFETVANDFRLTQENCPTNGAFIKTERLIQEYQKGVMMFAACFNNQLIGFFSLGKKQDGIYELHKLSILPQFRHYGYGKAILDYSQKIVKSLNGTCITVGIINENSVLKNWYATYGFIENEITKFTHLPFTVCFMSFNI